MLTVGEVLAANFGRWLGGAVSPEFRLSRVVVDSRAVTPGSLFVALKGERHDGHTFVAETLRAGASAALVEYVPADLADETAAGRHVDLPSLVSPSSSGAPQVLSASSHLELVSSRWARAVARAR